MSPRVPPFPEGEELPAAELGAIAADMERPRPAGPRPRRCDCERPLVFRDAELGRVCSKCGREPR